MSSSLRFVRKTLGAGLVTALLVGAVSTAWAQDGDRDATRDRTRSALRQIGPKLGVTFQQS